MSDDRYTLTEARAIIDAEKCQFEGYYCVRHDALLDQGTGACDDRPEVVVVAAQLLATVERVQELLSETHDWTPYDTRDIGEAFPAESVTDLVSGVMAAINGEDEE